jgi:hypothetical protein
VTPKSESKKTAMGQEQVEVNGFSNGEAGMKTEIIKNEIKNTMCLPQL